MVLCNVKNVTMMCVCVTGSQPPENSLTEAPTDPDGPNGVFLVTCECICSLFHTIDTAGVVTGVVVGIVVLSLSIAGAATAAGMI